MVSTEIFIKNRNKQTIKLVIKIGAVLLIVTALLITVFISIAKDRKENLPESDSVEVTQKKPMKICLDPDLHTTIIENIDLPEGWEIPTEISEKYDVTFALYSETEYDCNAHIARNVTADSEFTHVWNNVYVAAARFDASIYEVTAVNNQLENGIASQSINDFRVIWAPETEEFLESKFGSVLGQEFNSSDEIINTLLTDKQVIAIIPFDQLRPEFKVLPLDGNYPYRKDFNIRVYRLTDSLWIKGEDNVVVESLIQYIKRSVGEGNYDATKLNDILITGGSALGAKSQYPVIEAEQDPLFPILGIADLLKSADIAHISNESSFTDTCVQYPTSGYYCGKANASEMITYAGIDIVGLSGNHTLDYGRPAFEETLQIYDLNNIKYYGAGKDFESAHTPAIIELAGKKIAFLGYNFVGPNAFYATTTLSGSASPDQYFADGARMKEDIENAKEISDYIFVDMQWGLLYSHNLIAQQTVYGRLAIDSGADIVTGVHPNYVQGIEYYNEGILFYGLGSFLLDDLSDPKAREGVIVRHIFYDSVYVGYELITTSIQENAQVVVSDQDQRDLTLQTIFENSNLNIIENE